MTKIKIPVNLIEESAWTMEGGGFVCAHDSSEVVIWAEDMLGPDGHYELYHKGYECTSCGDLLDDDPDYDLQEAAAEAQLMDILGK